MKTIPKSKATSTQLRQAEKILGTGGLRIVKQLIVQDGRVIGGQVAQTQTNRDRKEMRENDNTTRT